MSVDCLSPGAMRKYVLVQIEDDVWARRALEHSLDDLVVTCEEVGLELGRTGRAHHVLPCKRYAENVDALRGKVRDLLDAGLGGDPGVDGRCAAPDVDAEVEACTQVSLSAL